MKKILFFLCILSATFLRAEKTNQIFPTLKIADGRTFTNAYISSVTPAHAMIIFDGGGARVAFKDLPEVLRAQYQFNPAQAEKFERETQEKKAATLATLKAVVTASLPQRSGEDQTLRVDSIMGDYAGNPRCICAGREILITGLPRDVRDFVNDLQRRSEAIKDAELNAEALSSDAGRWSEKTRNLPYVDSDAGKITQWHLKSRAADLKQDAIDAGKSLERSKHELDELRKESPRRAAIVAYPTNHKFGGLEIWKYVGKPPMNFSAGR